MANYVITDNDFNECIGNWLNSGHAEFQSYVKGIKLFKEFLEGKYDGKKVDK